MVATTDVYASEVALEVLRSGGNAVDAAVAASFALAVVNPEAGNVAGGGFLLARQPDGSVEGLDYRSQAPSRATRRMFGGQAEVRDRSLLGHLSVAVPGAVAGLWEAHGRLGSLPWPDLVAPAISLAEGFVGRERFVASFTREIVGALAQFEESAKIFLPRRVSGAPAPPAVGDTFRQPELARTLERISAFGAEGFYSGETADLIVAEMERGGGVISHADLAGYSPAWRTPVSFEYRGCHIASMPPSSSGGITLAEMCNILREFPIGELAWHGSDHIHLMAEAWRRSFADRNHHLADPDYAALPIEELVSQAYGAYRASTISPDSSTPSSGVEPGRFPSKGPDSAPDGSSSAFLGGPSGGALGGPLNEGDHTTHISIVDEMGGAVSLTTTLNTWYGSKLVVAGAGFLLNNEMDDFSVIPGKPNHFGLVQGEANAIEPGKRMLSAMTPTIVLSPEGELFLVVGTPGGATILTTVYQVISNLIDFGMDLAESVQAPRVHHQHLPDRIEIEPGGLPEGVVEELKALGHHLHGGEELWGDVQAILTEPEGALVGVADPRRGGTALGE